MYNCILFDMDGTLVNSYEGIYHAYRVTMEKLGHPFGGEAFVRRAIGAPLPWVFQHLCRMEEDAVSQAVRYYRSYYAERGKHQASVYDGMANTLSRLKKAGCYLATATLKKEIFAREMLKELGLFSCFDVVYGADEEGRLTKADLIRKCMEAAGATAGDTILVGDSPFDADGAAEAGTAFLGVTYGFGFRDREAAQAKGASLIADTPAEIAALLLTNR